MRYAEVTTHQDSESWRAFEAVAYPKREGLSLGWPDKDAALEHMMQWECGEACSSEVFHDYQTEHPGNRESDYVETETHVVTWHTGLCHVALYRKVPTGTVYLVEVESGTGKARTHSVLTQPEGMKLFRRMCELHEFGPEEVSLWEITVYPDEHEDLELLELA
ncbi:hypothetical protein ACFP2T_43380 [Plantactinospora solaniradicis]|uniref:Uncharacterized protein n=1 Tax=Plantactinospora solaniradicis TaxID=1723736 RepID=A0ABW1KNU8_9ACTN